MQDAKLFAVSRKGRPSATMPHTFSRHHGHFAVLLPRGPDDNLNVLSERGEELHEALDGKGSGAVAHQCGNVRLPYTENLSRFRLLEAALLDEAVDLEGELGLQEFLLRMR